MDRGEEIEERIVEIFEEEECGIADQLTVLSILLVKIAAGQSMNKKSFLHTCELVWDRIAPAEDEKDVLKKLDELLNAIKKHKSSN